MRLLKLHTPISFTQTHAIKAGGKRSTADSNYKKKLFIY